MAPGQGVGVARRHQDRPVADHLGNRARRRGHDRHPGRHGLERGEAEALVDRRVGEDGGARQQPVELLVGQEPGTDDSAAPRGVGERGGEGLCAPAARRRR